jgi:fluoroquinolone transport system ATP-binding protein
MEFRSGQGMERREFNLEGLGSNQDFLSVLRENAVETLHSQEATLEEIFIQVTGRSLL